MTEAMQAELKEIVEAERLARGLLGARSYALSLMLTSRHKQLSAWLNVPLSLDSERTLEVIRLNAECTLLMIERGA